MSESSTDVLVVGAGPTGLLLAGDLAGMGHRVEVLERRSAKELNLTRAFSIHARTMDQLAIRGLTAALIEAGSPVKSIPLIGKIDIPFHKLRTSFPFMLAIPQYVLEKELRTRAEANGVEFSHGVEVESLKQSHDRVIVSGHNSSGDSITREARFAVGADGLRSTVRKAIGVGFPGEEVLTSVIIADAKLGNPPPTLLAVEVSRWGFGFLCPFGDGYYRILAWNRKTPAYVSDDIDFATLKDLLGKIFKNDLDINSPRWISRFHSDERLADAYRVGRVFLVGDAAHVHSPAGGLGMNIGIQDSANLAWKLSFALAANEPIALLDSYEPEMRSVGASAIKVSGDIIRAAKRQSMIPAPLRWAMVNVLSNSGAVGDALALRLATSIAGITTRFSGPDSGSRTGKFWDGSAVFPEVNCHLRLGSFVLLSPEIIEDFGKLADSRRVVNVKSPAHEDDLLLIRPDGYIAWQSGEPVGRDRLAVLLEQHVPA